MLECACHLQATIVTSVDQTTEYVAMLELFCNDTLTLQIGDDKRMHPVTFVGQTVGGKILLQASNMVVGMRMPGTICTVRYIHEGQVHGFRTKLMRILDQPERILFLDPPSSVEAIQIRKSRRYPLSTFGSMNIGDEEVSVLLRDISSHGCMVRLPRSVTSQTVTDEVTLNFFLPVGGDVHLKCYVRRRLDNAEMGLEFITVGTGAQDLEAFLRHIAIFFADDD